MLFKELHDASAALHSTMDNKRGIEAWSLSMAAFLN
jgi:hypothetical protein